MKIFSIALSAVLGAFFPLLLVGEVPAAGKHEVLVIGVNGAISPVSAEFITKNIKRANKDGYSALVIELDTPGGLDTSMREIIKAINASGVPVVVYVAPNGARAASAGAFITIAAHVAAMAPQTNIGAAHPVGVGSKMDKVSSEKATNDAAAYIRSLASARGRNADWAEDAVRKSVSIEASEALEKKVVDIVSGDVPSLMKSIDGWKVKTALSESHVLKTADAQVVRLEMGVRHRILDFITNPNVAYILMILGFYGLFFEMTNPGAVFPGVAGGICLILAFYAFQTLPVNYAGLLLMLLAIILFALETQITSYGALAIGGIISMALGSVMLFDRTEPYLRLSLFVVVPAVLLTAVFVTLTLGLAIKAQGRKPATGAEGLVGAEGVALGEVSPETGGMVMVHGERWSANSNETIGKGAKVVVVAVSGLKLTVRKK